MSDKNNSDLTNEQVTEVIHKQGHRDIASFTNPPVAPGENSRFLRFALVSWDLPPIDISDPEQVRERITQYFHHCADNDRKPQIVGMCNWLGITRATLNNWLNGTLRSETHLDLIKKAVNLIEEQWADYMQNGKINPASGIFLGKNWYGYKDVADVVVTPNNPLQDMDTETARKRLEDAIPTEDED